MQPVVRPRVVASQRLEDDERLRRGTRVVDGPLQAEVPARPPGRGHPVEDVLAFRVGRRRFMIRGGAGTEETMAVGTDYPDW